MGCGVRAVPSSAAENHALAVRSHPVGKSHQRVKCLKVRSVELVWTVSKDTRVDERDVAESPNEWSDARVDRKGLRMSGAEPGIESLGL